MACRLELRENQHRQRVNAQQGAPGWRPLSARCCSAASSLGMCQLDLFKVQIAGAWLGAHLVWAAAGPAPRISHQLLMGRRGNCLSNSVLECVKWQPIKKSECLVAVRSGPYLNITICLVGFLPGVILSRQGFDTLFYINILRKHSSASNISRTSNF